MRSNFHIRSVSIYIASLALAVVPSVVFAQIESPIAVTSVFGLLATLLSWMLGLAAIVAMIALVYGGIRMMTALGRENEVAKAKQIILWAIAGIAVVVLSFFFIEVVLSEILS